MIRGWACVLLILVSTLAAVPNLPVSHASVQQLAAHNNTFPLKDPNGPLKAFNYTYAQADLYTNSSNGIKVTPAPNTISGTTFKWLNTVPRTTNGTQVSGTALSFNLTAPSLLKGSQEVNWTLRIPQFNCVNCNTTIVRFAFFGSLTKGTSANYTLTFTNGTQVPVSQCSGIGFFPCSRTDLGPCVFPTVPLSQSCGPRNDNSQSCGSANVCLNATKFIGFDLRLSFRFGWNSSETGLTVDVGELVVTSIDTTFKNSVSNSMAFNSTDTSKVVHTARLFPIKYNSTVSYLNQTGASVTHIWSIETLNIYYPAGYKITRILLNSTAQTPILIYPLPPEVAFENTPCKDSACSVSLLALNMSDFRLFSRNSTDLVLTATTPNTLSPLSTLAGNAPINSFMPNEQISVKVSNALTVVNASATTRAPENLTITFFDPTGNTLTIPRKSYTTSSGGLFNNTIPAASLNPFGLWNITVSFINNFDMGFKFQTFTVRQILLAPGSFSYIGSNSLLTVTGKLTYTNQSAASAVNGTVFAMDAAFGTNPITTTNTSSTSLYISNITLVNGIFTTGQPLRMFFTVVNPTTRGFNATLTIEHEWPGSISHGVRATFPLDLGDQPFTFGPVVYKADIFLLSTGVQIQVTSLTTHNARTVTASLGLSPVLSSRQHSGLFKITISSLSGSQTFVPNSLESPAYGYVVASGFVPGKLLAFSKPFTTQTDGTFSTTFTSARILGAQKLVLLVLARAGNGIVLGNQDPTIQPPDSTILQSSLDAPSEAAVKQAVTVTLRLKNNSTKITFSLTINAELSGSGTVPSKTAALPPGGQQDLPFTFTTPSSPGVYTLTFSSPEYGAPLLTKTLQVSLLQSNLQILVPAIIGLVAALVILGFYLVKKSPEVAPDTKEKQRPSSGKPSKPQGQPTSKSLTRT